MTQKLWGWTIGNMGIFVPLFAAIVSFTLRAYEIGLSSYSIDEMVSLSQALSSNPWSWSWDNVPGLYPLLLKVWLSFCGESEISARILSAIFSAGATAVLSALAMKVGGLRAALLVAFFHIANPLSLQAAREVRGYGLFEFLASVQFSLFFGFLGYGRRRSYSYLVVSALSVATHWLGCLPFLMQMLWLGLVAESRSIRLRGFQLVGIAVVVLVAGVLSHVRWDYLQWQVLKFEVEPLSRWPILVTNELTAGSGFSVVAAVALVMIAILGTRFSKTTNTRIPEILRTLAVAIAGVLISAAAMGWMLERAVLLPRYFVFLIAPVVMLLGLSVNVGLEANFLRRISALFALIIFCVSTAVHWPIKQESKGPPWRDLARMIVSYPESLVMTSKTTALQYPYFLRGGVPVERWDHGPQQYERLEQQIQSYQSVWIVESAWSASQIFPTLMGWLKAHNLSYDVIRSADHANERIVTLKIQGTKK
ncbi:MAG: hypothetical protein K2X47_16780 [Bdellovibrionales bacterium]|nr:hypothetical protein [Bdellovibrionales bacterium]